jgi:HTH-type transcriptional regulator/antitoxin HigA
MEEMSAIAINHEAYKDLLLKYEPHAIESDQDNEQALEICSSLARKGDAITGEELALLKLISAVVHDYESKRYQEWNVELTGREMLKALMESKGLSQSDLAEIMPQSRVSEVLSGHRVISKAQALALGERFRINPVAFLL